MFSVEGRARVRDRVLELAAADPAVTGAAVTGSYVADGGDRWSDIDLAFGIHGPLSGALERADVVRARDQGSLRRVPSSLGQLSQVLASCRAVCPRHPHRYHVGQVDDHAILVRLAVIPGMV